MQTRKFPEHSILKVMTFLLKVDTGSQERRCFWRRNPMPDIQAGQKKLIKVQIVLSAFWGAFRSAAGWYRCSSTETAGSSQARLQTVCKQRELPGNGNGHVTFLFGGALSLGISEAPSLLLVFRKLSELRWDFNNFNLQAWDMSVCVSL